MLKVESRMKESKGKGRLMKGEERNKKKMKRYGRIYKVKKGEGRRMNGIEGKSGATKENKGEGQR